MTFHISSVPLLLRILSHFRCFWRNWWWGYTCL